MNKNNGLFDYIRWRGDLSFAVSPVNEVDNVIFSILSYIDYSGIIDCKNSIETVYDGAKTLSAAICQIEQEHPQRRYLGAIFPEKMFDVAVAASRTERFSNVLLNCHENTLSETENIQFSATTFILPDGTLFISYRGTDDTLVGWKEDFYMAFESPVPSQIKALEYLNKVAEKSDRPIILGGHSKGGNLAIWSAVKCSEKVKGRIIKVYSNDGPGFPSVFYKSVECNQIADRLVKIIPDSSIVGLLLEESSYFRIIKSSQKNLLQHNPLSWVVNVNEFAQAEDISDFSRKSDKALKRWLSSLSVEERREFVDTLFNALSSGNAKSLTDINASRMKSAASVAHYIKNLDKDLRRKLLIYLRRFVSYYKNN